MTHFSLPILIMGAAPYGLDHLAEALRIVSHSCDLARESKLPNNLGVSTTDRERLTKRLIDKVMARLLKIQYPMMGKASMRKPKEHLSTRKCKGTNGSVQSI